MNPRLATSILLFASILVATADAPRKAPLTRYSRLWTDSPFTSKPVVAAPDAVANPLEDYALGGITRMADGYYAILLNKKKPDEPAVVIRPGSRNGFEVVDVKRGSGGWKETVVTVRNGRNTGTVTFEDGLLTVKANVAPPPPQQVAPGQPEQGGRRQPRPRVIVPPQAPQGQQVQPGQQQGQQQAQQPRFQQSGQPAVVPRGPQAPRERRR